MIGRTGPRALAGGIGAVLMAACIRGTLPPRELYRLLPPDSTTAARMMDAVRGAPALEGPLEVEPYETPGLYGEPQIVYRVGDTQYGTYPSREWAIPLSNMLATLTADELRALPLASGPVVAEPVPSGHGYRWRGVVREFEEVDRGSRLLAAVHLEASLVRARDGLLLWRGSARLEREVGGGTISAIVATLSALADSAVVELGQQAYRSLRSSASASRLRGDRPR